MAQTVEQKYLKPYITAINRFKKAVKRGANLLDRKGPKDWDLKIKKKLLDLSDGNSCILGQAFGSVFETAGYDQGVETLRLMWNRF
jgi:hypothetical protein